MRIRKINNFVLSMTARTNANIKSLLIIFEVTFIEEISMIKEDCNETV